VDLETWMQNNKLVDQDVADKVGVTRPYVTRIRNGRVHPNLGVALAIWDMSDGEIDLRQLLPLHMRPKPKPPEPVKPPPDASGKPRKQLAPKASKSPATA
jgi:transcriptional regulator with XRE-family HTH domain